jgi:tRNA dimethylallyltransferase
VYELSGISMSEHHANQSSQPLPYRLLKLALIPSDRKVLHHRIAIRFKQMLEEGFVDEVKHLIKQYPSLTPDSTAMRCVGYRQVWEYLNGEYDKDELLDRGIFATRQLAKRQLTWLRGMTDIVAVDCLYDGRDLMVKSYINQFIKN